ncbi:aldose 1-epimerase family protein [Flavobacterium frigoris]|uniref:Galactose mutarotase n=1 Tax=Flavobacterium frigoris TaxID=229204 RepID=A0A1H9MG15_FLAFI|nr:aldose 1-epimerase family protein [Flavobacterium frigoris]SER22395.1 Galactose mutarotase [Flavobacterium frigoris]
MITTIQNSNLTAQIKLLGAELCSLENNNSIEYIWDGNPDFWGKHSPILFPIVGTLKNNSYQYDGKEYCLSGHGFARDMVFELIDKKDNSATFSIQSSDNIRNRYPFNFELQIKYTLENSSLFIGYKVVNKTASQMPFSIGAHPAFALSGNFEDYSLQFEKEEPLEYNLLQNDLISNETKMLDSPNNLVRLKYELFENDALIFKSLQSKHLTILKNQTPLIRVRYPKFPHLGIWTKMNAPFLCIEPWFGYSDSVESTGNLMEKEGIQIIESGQIFEAAFSIEIL